MSDQRTRSLERAAAAGDPDAQAALDQSRVREGGWPGVNKQLAEAHEVLKTSGGFFGWYLMREALREVIKLLPERRPPT